MTPSSSRFYATTKLPGYEFVLLSTPQKFSVDSSYAAVVMCVA